MADTWEARVTAGNIAVTEPGPGPFGFDGGTTGVMYYAFVAADLPDSRYPTIMVRYRVNPGGTDFETYEQHGFSAGADAQAGFVPHGSGTSSFTGTTEFETGGLLKITKDETAEEYQFDGLIGTSTVPFADIVGTVNDGELAPHRIYVHSQAVSTFDDGTHFASTEVDTALTVRYDNFFGAKNATDIKGADLGSTDRGSWESFGGSFVPWGVFLSTDATGATADTASAIGFTVTIDGDGPATGANGTAFREWDQAVYLGGVTTEGMVDMTRAIEHGALWAAIIYSANPTEVKDRRSFDTGGTWEEVLVYSATSANSSISVVWNSGKVVTVWQSGSDILQSFSRDLGTVWSTPVTLSITGTNPRLLVRPDGIAFYFFCDGDDLNLLRSADFGATFLDGTPILVASAIGAQTVAAQFGSDGSIVVGYIVSGAWTQVRSRDLGLTFA